jgi:hypothetical protein
VRAVLGRSVTVPSRARQVPVEIAVEQNGTIVFPLPIEFMWPFTRAINRDDKSYRKHGSEKAPV